MTTRATVLVGPLAGGVVRNTRYSVFAEAGYQARVRNCPELYHARAQAMIAAGQDRAGKGMPLDPPGDLHVWATVRRTA